jgi:hypothetical protein
MRATIRKYSRHWLVHAIIVVIAIVIGVVVALKARPTRGESPERSVCIETGKEKHCRQSDNHEGHEASYYYRSEFSHLTQILGSDKAVRME